MEVILKEDIANLGKIGEVVRVRDGYARNYLLPRGLVLVALPGINSGESEGAAGLLGSWISIFDSPSVMSSPRSGCRRSGGSALRGTGASTHFLFLRLQLGHRLLQRCGSGTPFQRRCRSSPSLCIVHTGADAQDSKGDKADNHRHQCGEDLAEQRSCTFTQSPRRCRRSRCAHTTR